MAGVCQVGFFMELSQLLDNAWIFNILTFLSLQSNFGVAPRYQFLEILLLQLAVRQFLLLLNPHHRLHSQLLQLQFLRLLRYPLLLPLVAVVVSETVFAPTLSTAALNGVTVELVRRTVTAILHQLLQLQFLRLLMYPLLFPLVAVVVSETVFAPTLSTAALNGVTVELVRRTVTAILHQLLQLQFLRLLMYPFLFLNPQFLRLLIYPASLIFQTMRMATVPVLTTL